MERQRPFASLLAQGIGPFAHFAAIAILICLATCAGFVSAQENEDTILISEYIASGPDLRRLTDDELEDELTASIEEPFPSERPFLNLKRSNRYGAEIVRRASASDRERWIVSLRKAVALAKATPTKFKSFALSPPVYDETAPRKWIELLACLRRLEGKPDPLSIVVVGADEATGKLSKPPTFELRVVNTELEHREIELPVDSRFDVSRGNFAVQALDENGQPLQRVRLIASGLSGFPPRLAFGEFEKWKLNLADFVKFETAGKYVCRVAYHLTEEICNEGPIDDQTVFWSAPFVVAITDD